RAMESDPTGDRTGSGSCARSLIPSEPSWIPVRVTANRYRCLRSSPWALGAAPALSFLLAFAATSEARAQQAPRDAAAPVTPPPREDASAKPAEKQKATATFAEPAPGVADKAWENAPPERRFGFMVGLAFGATLGQAAGFPNDPKKIDRLSYY